MSERQPKNFSSADAKALWHFAWHHVAWPYVLEYAVVFTLTGIVSVTLLHKPFFQPVAAVGVMAMGWLYRWFKLTSQPRRRPAQLGLPISSAQLDSLLKPYGTKNAADPAADATPGPYL